MWHGRTPIFRSCNSRCRRASGRSITIGSASSWRASNEALIAHCEAIGRDHTEIRRTLHLAWEAGADPSALADQAAELGERGIDQVIFSMRGPYVASEVEPLGAELLKRG